MGTDAGALPFVIAAAPYFVTIPPAQAGIAAGFSTAPSRHHPTLPGEGSPSFRREQ